MQFKPKPPPEAKAQNPDAKIEVMKDMPFDEAINVDESESVESEKEDEAAAAAAQPSGVQVQAQQKPQLKS